LYAVLAFAVAARRHELAVRLAVGARPRDLVRVLLGDAGATVLGGVILGGPLGFVLLRLLGPAVLGAARLDLPTFALAVAALLAATGTAAGAPARRAASVAPSEALHGA